MIRFGTFFRSTSSKVAIGIVIGTAISVPAAVFAATSFTDVPTSHPFYKEINAVAEAGVARGFSDGTYRPGSDITRQAMAAFMERGLGRAAAADGSIVVRSSSRAEVAAVVMEAGATGPGTGFVHVSGSLFASTSAATSAGCPCTVEVDLLDGASIVNTSYAHVPLMPNGQESIGSTSVQAVVPVAGDSTHRFSITTRAYNTFAAEVVIATATIAATYFPLSGDGDSTLEYELTCPKDDALEPNDSFASVQQFFFNSNSTSAIVCPSDDDWYWDQVSPGATITVDLRFTHSQGDIDVCLYRYTTEVGCSTGVSNSEFISHSGAVGGDYVVRVYLISDSGSAPGNEYELRVSK